MKLLKRFDDLDYYLNEQGYLHSIWKPGSGTKHYREIVNYSAKAMVDHNVGLWLSDCVHLAAVNPPDTDWLANDWLPRVVKTTPFYAIAILYAKDAYGQMSHENAVHEMQEAGHEVASRMRFFGNEAEAEQWLLSLKK